MNNTISRLAIVALVTALGAGCASTAGYDYQYTQMGAATGAVLGGVLGHQINGKNGRYAGAAAGALIGGMTGYNADQISAINRGHGIQGYIPNQDPYRPPSHYQQPGYYQQPSAYPYSPTAYTPYPPRTY